MNVFRQSKLQATEATPLATGTVTSSMNAATSSSCPVLGDSGLDPAAVPLPVAILLPLGFFLWGLGTWIRLMSKMDDGQEQLYHGIYMTLVAYPLGLAIPHARIKKAMSLAHGASLLQGISLMVCGLAWHSNFGFVDGTPVSVWAKYLNMYGMWGNTAGILWGATAGATDLFYTTKDTVAYRAPRWVENIQHVVLKSQGLCNIIATVMILNQLVSTIENQGK